MQETWREKIRKAEARASELEKEGSLGSKSSPSVRLRPGCVDYCRLVEHVIHCDLF